MIFWVAFVITLVLTWPERGVYDVNYAGGFGVGMWLAMAISVTVRAALNRWLDD